MLRTAILVEKYIKLILKKKFDSKLSEEEKNTKIYERLMWTLAGDKRWSDLLLLVEDFASEKIIDIKINLDWHMLF